MPTMLTSSILLVFLAGVNTPAQSRAGTYAFSTDNGSGEIRISNTNHRSFRFKIGVGSRTPACVGDFINRANWIAANVAEYRFDMDDTHACRLIFVFSGSDLIVKECECSNFHGASCNFEGTYTKVRSSRK